MAVGRKLPVFVLDGGLGTTLEDVFHRDISTPLWSAKPIESDPEVIIAAHLAFLRAGADIILTSTYQCAYNTFERSGYSRDDANRIMLKSVRLAAEARCRFLQQDSNIRRNGDNSMDAHTPRSVKIALSLGPYGATLSPAHEFDGFYPPPYGPDLPCDPGRTNAFEDTDQERAQERAAIDALTNFHYERLKVFADDLECWDTLDFVAFETVPLRREIFAIRRAVARLQSVKGWTEAPTSTERGIGQMRPWWISTVHPDGRYPEMKAGAQRASASEVVEAVLLDAEGEGTSMGTPWGFGINCTSVEFLPGLLEEARKVVERASIDGRRPWLVLYPNRGDTYDPETQTWVQLGREGPGWAKYLRVIALDSLGAGVWGGIIVGGCCKAGPDEIGCLARELQT